MQRIFRMEEKMIKEKQEEKERLIIKEAEEPKTEEPKEVREETVEIG